MSQTSSMSFHKHDPEGRNPKVTTMVYRSNSSGRIAWHLDVDGSHMAFHGYPLSVLDDMIEALQDAREEAKEMSGEEDAK